MRMVMRRRCGEVRGEREGRVRRRTRGGAREAGWGGTGAGNDGLGRGVRVFFG